MNKIKIKKTFILLLLVWMFVPSAYSQRRMENLDRALIAAKVTGGVFVNWRITGQEWRGVSYKLYRDETAIHTLSATEASNYLDASGTLTSKYKVAAVVDGIEQTACAEVAVLPNPYIEINLQPIPKIAGVPDSYYNNYITNDITTADLDGDGAYDFIVKRMNEGYDSANPFENKYYTLFDAYKSDGTFMWRIDVGPNLFHNVEITVIAYDYDGDGKAEVVMRTSEGTVDGLGNIIPDLGNAQGANTPDGKTNYRDQLQNNGQWFEYEGPEYLSLFDGETGKMLDRIDHIARQPVSQWGTSGTKAGGLAHRSTKFFYGAPYLDGRNPSLLITRGIYYRTKMETYDIVDKKFVPRWSFDSGTGAYCGQGNHNYTVADVDNDGRDEIVYGSMTVDDDGRGLYSTGLGHGDAIHVGDFDPYRKGLEVFACLEESPYYGTTLRAAEDGKILLQYIKGSDCGRAIAANWSNASPGAELAPAGISGSVCSASTRTALSIPGGSQNFRIFWDGDLLEELVDHNSFSTSTGKGVGKVQKFNGSSWTDVLVTTGYYSCNHTKGTPCLQADILGDWREELIYKSDDESKIRIYFTTDVTNYRIYTLMHDMQYRNAIAWQMSGYNQPPHTSFFLGELEGITMPPPPVMTNHKMVYNTSFNWNNTAGKELLFDISSATTAVALTAAVSPKSLTVNSPGEYTFNVSGSGKWSGSMILVKQGNGTFTFNGTHDYTGATELWDGQTVFNGQLASPVWLNLFAELSATGTLGDNVLLNYGSVLYPGGKETDGTLSIGGDLTLKNNAILEWDMDNNAAQSDRINLSGVLKITGKPVFRIKRTADLAAGDYILLQTASVNGNLSDITVEGLESQIASLSYTGGNVVLSVSDMRNAASVIWKGDKTGAVWNLANDANFTLNGSDVYFAAGDDVTFDDSSVSKTVNKVGDLPVNNIRINATSDYTIQGSGKITGSGSLSKTGTGKLTLKGVNEYTGATIVTGGTLAVEIMPNLGNAGSTGFPSSDPNQFILDEATFTTAGSAITSAQALKVGDNGGTIHANATINWEEIISGKKLIKTGTSALNLYTANPSLDTLLIKDGSVSLKTEDANGRAFKNIVLESGVLNTLDGSGSYSTSAWNIVVPEGKTATITLDSRCDYAGKLTGGGTLSLRFPYVRTYLNGNWSTFTGKINATTDSDGGTCSINNTYGLGNAELNVTGGSSAILTVYKESGGSFAIGALSGNVYSTLENAAWTIGAKNTNTTFEGIIKSSSLTKTGTGTLTLSGANTYTGTTTINGGRLLAMNTSGSATGTGMLIVNNGAVLGGKGFIGGTVTLNNGATLEPGDHTSTSASSQIGTLTFAKNLTLNASATLALNVRYSALGSMPDKLVVKGALTAAGNLVVTQIGGTTSFGLNTELQLLDLQGTVSGEFASVALPELSPGLTWDISNLLTSGTIKVVSSSIGISPVENNPLHIYPNPASDFIVVELPGASTAKVEILNLPGSRVLSQEISSSGKVDITRLPKGLYLLKINAGGKSHTKKIIKQ
jgi:autotransporter-associated beta strand protein